jgi:hypothetical protein
MQKAVEEYLYSAMEDFVIDIMIDQGPNARSVRLNLPKFTLIGATTRSGLISAPLRSRGSGSPTGSTTTRPRIWDDRAALGRHPRGRHRRGGALEIGVVRAARRASRTTCCAGCATMRR